MDKIFTTEWTAVVNGISEPHASEGKARAGVDQMIAALPGTPVAYAYIVPPGGDPVLIKGELPINL